MSQLDQKANLVARQVLDQNGKAQYVLDFLGSPMNHPRYRITSFIRNFREFTVTEQHKYSPELISQDEYGRTDLWWVICRYNGIVNPLSPTHGFIPGRRIRIPARVDVEKWLKAVSSERLQEITLGSQTTSLVTL